MDQLPKIVAERLKMSPVRQEEHPDPDLLTAFLEQALGNDERANVLKHLTTCADCREVMSLAMPELEAAMAPAQPSPQAWYRWPALRWGTATAVAALAIAVGLFYGRAGFAPRTTQQANMGTSAPLPSNQSGATTPPPLPSTISGASRSATSPRPEPVRHPGQGTSQRSKLRIPATAPVVETQLASNTEPASQTAPPSGTEVAAESAEAVFSKAKEPPKENASQSPSPAPTTPSPVSPQLVGPPGMMVYGAKSPRWRVSASGELQRSFDVESWQTLKVGDNVVFRAVSSTGKDVWVGGHNGALYHSPDAGGRWVRIQPTANGAALTADITAIEFTDQAHGKLTTAAGAIWATSDAGQTWQVQ